jgi:uncharacterized protein YecE (DUF72 family)
MLRTYARTFPAVEIDSSYYGVPSGHAVAAMAARTPPNFRFSFKAPKSVTHPAGGAAALVDDEAKLLVESLEPVRSAGKLACVLAQFPNGFKPEGDAVAYVARVAETFDGVPLVFEFRNRRWQQPETLELLGELGAGYANVDMPALEGLLEPSSDASGAIGYVRFHGRNAGTWWRGSNVTRYDYLYSVEELVPWADRIAEIEAQSRDTYAFFNNHANGKAPRNAEMLADLLLQRYGDDAAECLAPVGLPPPEQPALPGLS